MEVNKLDELVRQYFNPDGLPSKAYQLFLEDLASHAIQVQALPATVEVEEPDEEMTHPFFEEKREYNFHKISVNYNHYRDRWYMPRYLLNYLAKGTKQVPIDVELRFNKKNQSITFAAGTTGGLRKAIWWNPSSHYMSASNFCYAVEGFPYGKYEYESHTDNSVTFKYVK